MKVMPMKFQLDIYEGKPASGEPIRQVFGQGGEWQNACYFSLPGSAVLQLDEFWTQALASKDPVIKETVHGLETIVKFGKTAERKPVYSCVLRREF
jgi:hypothetical protein